MSGPKRSLLAPEVVQTSAMDCGPAALKCLLEGFGVPVSYGRLREACQTSVDGTSIDTLEEVAGQLGLAAQQVLLPRDCLLLPEADALPALAVVQLTSGFTHFVVIWRAHGPLVQVMDPAHGRRFIPRAQLLGELYVHQQPLPAAAYREWAASDEGLSALRARLRSLGALALVEPAIAAALREPGWRPLAALDAAARMAGALARAGGLPRGEAAARLVVQLAQESAGDPAAIPEAYWSAQPHVPAPGEPPPPEELVRMRGAVLLRIEGRRADAPSRETLPPELRAALVEEPRGPLREALALLGQEGARTLRALFAATVAAALATLAEGLLLRGLLDDVGGRLSLGHQRLGLIVAVTGFLTLSLLLEHTGASLAWRLGRQLEARLRMAFLRKLPRLGERYFQSRPVSDMAMRAYSASQLAAAPSLLAQVVRPCAELCATVAALIWLDPASAGLALATLAFALLVPVLLAPLLTDPDLRRSTHAGSLARFSLDALLGLSALRAHRAERAFRREFEAILLEWSLAGRALARRTLLPFAILYPGMVALSGWLFLRHLAHHGGGATLLFLYWTLALPPLAEELFQAVRQVAPVRNSTLRLLEPLGALEEAPGGPAQKDALPQARGAALSLQQVDLVIAGLPVLRGIDLSLRAGEHVAVAGRSGAGKSSLAGLLLGWHSPAAGEVLVDGERLLAGPLARLRLETAWVDPAVQLWNTSLYENLLYGTDGSLPVAGPIDAALLTDVLERLPEGLQTVLGEGGGLVSGGEGQRVRLARALLRKDARLVLLDEPFRGLDREKRRALLARARAWWKDATLVYISHDVRDALAFDRVVVLDEGRVAEDGPPALLAERQGGHFQALLTAEHAVRVGLWQGAQWRRLRLEGGAVVESARQVAPTEGGA